MSRQENPFMTGSGRVRVLIVNSTLHVGGAERVAALIAQHVKRESFEVRACYLKECGIVGDEMRAAGVSLFPVPGLVHGKRDYLTALKLMRLIREFDIDIVHTHDMHGFMDAAVCRILRPALRFVHTFHFGNYPQRSTRYRMIEQVLWRVPDALVAVGNRQEHAIRELYGIPARRITTIWNGVTPPQGHVTSQCRERLARDSRPVIASISTLIPQKGIEYLIDAAALLRDAAVEFQLVIAGDGHLKSELTKRVSDRGLEQHVHFWGWIPNAAEQLMPLCDIFVQSSLWEAMSVVILEAMAAGKPIVATQVGDNTEVIADGVSGLLVPPKNPVALAGALESLLKSVELRSRLAAGASRRYSDNFTVARMIATYEGVYRKLAATRQRNPDWECLQPPE
jgi:glycosyltransferase involved in cell wall biosynthesis